MFFVYMIVLLLVRLVSWVKTKNFDTVSAQDPTGMFVEIRTCDYSSGSQTVFCGSQRNQSDYSGDPGFFYVIVTLNFNYF
jgi:hypothetical protein